NRRLRVRGGAGAADGTAAVDLVGATERFRVCRRLADHALEHLRNRGRAVLRGECGMHPMALRLPLVLDDDGTADRVEIAIAPGVEVEVTRERAIERGDGDGILDQRARIGC